MKKKLTLIGLVTGLVNGLLGGAAGLICVPLIKAAMKEGNKAHAYTVVTVLAVICERHNLFIGRKSGF